MKELKCHICQKPHKRFFVLEITSRRKGDIANYLLCRRCLLRKLREFGFEFLIPPKHKREGVITIWMCDRCHERFATCIVENIYCGAPGFNYTFFFCDLCEAADTEAFERDLQAGRISWQWKRNIRPIYEGGCQS